MKEQLKKKKKSLDQKQSNTANHLQKAIPCLIPGQIQSQNTVRKLQIRSGSCKNLDNKNCEPLRKLKGLKTPKNYNQISKILSNSALLPTRKTQVNRIDTMCEKRTLRTPKSSRISKLKTKILLEQTTPMSSLASPRSRIPLLKGFKGSKSYRIWNRKNSVSPSFSSPSLTPSRTSSRSSPVSLCVSTSPPAYEYDKSPKPIWKHTSALTTKDVISLDQNKNELKVSIEKMPKEWFPGTNDVQLSEATLKEDGMVSMKLALMLICQGETVTPPIFFIKISSRDRWLKVIVKKKQEAPPDEKIKMKEVLEINQELQKKLLSMSKTIQELNNTINELKTSIKLLTNGVNSTNSLQTELKSDEINASIENQDIRVGTGQNIRNNENNWKLSVINTPTQNENVKKASSSNHETFNSTLTRRTPTQNENGTKASSSNYETFSSTLMRRTKLQEPSEKFSDRKKKKKFKKINKSKNDANCKGFKEFNLSNTVNFRRRNNVKCDSTKLTLIRQKRKPRASTLPRDKNAVNYVDDNNLEESENPEELLESILSCLICGNWRDEFRALDNLRILIIHHPKILSEVIPEILFKLREQLSNLRSNIVKNTLLCFCCFLKWKSNDIKKKYLKTVILPLIKCSADQNNFLSEEGNRTLYVLVKAVHSKIVLYALLSIANEPSEIYKAKVAQFTAKCVSRLDSAVFDKKLLFDLIKTQPPLLYAKLIECRHYSAEVVKILGMKCAFFKSSISKEFNKLCKMYIPMKFRDRWDKAFSEGKAMGQQIKKNRSKKTC